MLDVTVLLLEDGYASTAIMPIEVFHSAGALWATLQGEEPSPRFRVTTASLDGRPGPFGGSALATNGLLHDEVLHALTPELRDP